MDTRTPEEKLRDDELAAAAIRKFNDDWREREDREKRMTIQEQWARHNATRGPKRGKRLKRILRKTGTRTDVTHSAAEHQERQERIQRRREAWYANMRTNFAASMGVLGMAASKAARKEG